MAGKKGYGYPQAAGAKGGPDILPPLPFKLTPKTVITEYEGDLIYRVLQSHEALGVYYTLLQQIDFQTGRGVTHYQTLEAMGTQPKPQQGGRRRQVLTRDMYRRIIAELEQVGLLTRDRQGNFANGQLHFVLPYRAYLADEWKKTVAQRNKALRLPLKEKARKPA